MKSLVVAMLIGITLITGTPTPGEQIAPTKVENKNHYYDSKEISLEEYLYELDSIAHFFVVAESEFKQPIEKPNKDKIKNLKNELTTNFNLKTLTQSERNTLNKMLERWEIYDWSKIEKDHNDISSIIKMYINVVPVEHEGKTYKAK